MAVIAFRDGDPRKVHFEPKATLDLSLIVLVQVLYPTNSKGEVCGQGAHEGKQYMMMFDITRHARINMTFKPYDKKTTMSSSILMMTK